MNVCLCACREGEECTKACLDTHGECKKGELCICNKFRCVVCRQAITNPGNIIFLYNAFGEHDRMNQGVNMYAAHYSCTLDQNTQNETDITKPRHVQDMTVATSMYYDNEITFKFINIPVFYQVPRGYVANGDFSKTFKIIQKHLKHINNWLEDNRMSREGSEFLIVNFKINIVREGETYSVLRYNVFQKYSEINIDSTKGINMFKELCNYIYGNKVYKKIKPLLGLNQNRIIIKEYVAPEIFEAKKSISLFEKYLDTRDLYEHPEEEFDELWKRFL